MLTKDDFNKIQLLITAGIGQVVKEVNKVKRETGAIKDEMGTMKDEIEEINNKIDLIPTKEEYFDSMDKLMGEIKKNREKLEEKAGISSSLL